MNNTAWSPLVGKGSANCPPESLSLAAEIILTHTHFDEPARVSYADGTLVNRHLWRERSLPNPRPIDQDSYGENQDPCGAHISLAAQPRGSDGLGGELIEHYKHTHYANLTAHEKEWKFLQEHVEQAYAAYRNSHTCWPQTTLNEWQKVEALARYATRWKMRTADVYASFHPVDVLFHSSYCTGAANILQALAMVAGFPTRFIAISNHSTVEIHVHNRWIWADNIISDGGITPNTFNYAEMTSDPLAIPSFTHMQREFYNSPTARYRSPYSLSAQHYWHFMSGAAKGRANRNDLEAGYGLSVPYDPSTAAALYPELHQHRFLCPQGWGPSICLSEKGSLIQARCDLQPHQIIRKSFFVSDCADNPIQSGVVKLRLGDTKHADTITASLNGVPLRHCGLNQRFQQDCVDFFIDPQQLQTGIQEIHFSNPHGMSVMVYPDPILPYTHPINESNSKTIADQFFSIDPCIAPAALEQLHEPLLQHATVTH